MSDILKIASVQVAINPTPPEMNLAPGDVEGLLEELHLYHMHFSGTRG